MPNERGTALITGVSARIGLDLATLFAADVGRCNCRRAGATLGGVSGGGDAFILSELDGKALEKVYTPLFGAVGCRPLACMSTSRDHTDYTCPRTDSRGKVKEYRGHLAMNPAEQVIRESALTPEAARDRSPRRPIPRSPRRNTKGR